METGSVPASPIELTATQLAWLKELGISKPSLPAGVSRHAAAKPVAAALSAGKDADMPAGALPGQDKSVQLTSSQSIQDKSLRQAVSRTSDDQSGRLMVNAQSSSGFSPESSSVKSSSPASSDPDASLLQAVDNPASSLAATHLQSLEAQIRQCESCGLCRERTHAVPGQGVMRPGIMVVGEAPGEQEDRQGLPFVGRSGQLLDNMLAAIAHRRETNVYITNVVKCRPPGNRNPDAQEIAACSSYLMRQLALIQPRAILAMGRFAAQTLLKKDVSMQALRGQVHFVDVENNQIPVVATYHPAYLLRRPVEKASAWQDLKRIEALVAK